MTTQKELFTRIAEVMSDDEEVVEFCNKKLAQLSKPSSRKANPEQEAMRAAILTFLSEQDAPSTSATVGEAMGISSRSACGILNYLVKNDQVLVVPAEDKHKAHTYVIA